MPTNLISTAGITGTDGVVPIYDPSARWCWWNKDEIYLHNGPGANRYVPKVNDYVKDTVTNEDYIVQSIDPVTLETTLRLLSNSATSGVLDPPDVLIGVGPGTPSDTYRVYLDTTVKPHVLAVDSRLKVAGSLSSYVKIFKGTNVGVSGKVISFLYDAGGVFLTQNIPLELAAIDSHTNHSIKVVSVCYTNEIINDGEIVTVVVYSADGHVVSKRQLLVENTSFIRSINSAQKYISHISLKSPFLSTADQNTLNYPINVPLQAFNMIGVVHYSDNSTLELPVDGNKFKIMGLERFVATVVGQEVQLGLSYSLSPGEVCYGAVSGDGKFVTAPYRLVVANQIGSYSVKVYGYPEWIDETTGYIMRYFMYNLDRDTTFEVTPFVSYNTDSEPFKTKAYGQNQRLSIRLNIRDVSSMFNSYIHIQTFDVKLINPATQRTPGVSNWTVAFEPNQVAPFGTGLKVKRNQISATLTKLDVSCGLSSLNEWLENVYLATKPLIDRRREVAPPTPNFFAITVGNTRYEFPVASWNNEIAISNTVEIDKTIFIEFIKRQASTDILLGKAGIQVFEQ